ncbi:MAG: hypothetical protein Kow0080_29310 [Candidatus Promineifilaceae bacterium]
MTLSPTWKRKLARLIAFKPVTLLMRVAIFILIPRHQVGTAIVLLDDKNRVLLLKHVFHPGYPWGIPGGWLNRGEDPETAVVREILEETGLEARVSRLLHVQQNDTPRHLEVIYQGVVVGGQLKLSAEIEEAGWFGLDELPPMPSISRRFIETAVQHNKQATIQDGE